MIMANNVAKMLEKSDGAEHEIVGLFERALHLNLLIPR